MKPKASLRSFLALAGSALLMTSQAHAVNANWTGGGTDALWSNTDNWSASPVPTAGQTATFNAAAGAGGSVIDLGAGVSVGTISFVGPNNAAYTIGAGAVNSQTLTLSGSGTNHGFGGSGTANTNQITVNAAILVNASQQWVINNGANPWIINGNVTSNAASGNVLIRNNGRGVTYNGILADGATSTLSVGGVNATTAFLTNPNNSFTGGIAFENGNTSVNSIGMIGANSAAGAGGPLLFGSGFGGGNLIYTGTGNTTNRVVTISHGNFGAGLSQSGTGNLNYTADTAFTAAALAVGSPTITLTGSTAGTGEFSGRITDHGTNGATPLRTGVSAGATSLILNSVDGVTIGSTVSATGVAPGTTVTAINTGTKTITLSVGTSGAVSQGASVTVDGLVNVTRVAKTGTGTWTLSGSNTHSGPTTVTGGILNLTNSLALQNSPIDTTLTSAGTASLGFRTSVTELTVGGLANSGAAKNLASIFTSTSGGYDTVTDLTLNPRAGGTFSYSGVIANGTSGMNLLKTGAGTQILNGANTYTGATTISDGTLALGAAGSIANSTGVNLTTASAKFNVTTANFTLGATQTLGGIGTVENAGSTFTANGVLAPGNSPGALTVDGGTMALGVGGDYNFEVLDASGAAGTGYDTMNLINGAILDLSLLTAGSYTINLTSLLSTGPDVAGNSSNFNNTLNYSWTLFSTASSLLSTFDSNDFTINAAGFTNSLGGGTFSLGLADGDTDLVLNFTAIPEPSSALLGGIGLLALLRRRR